MKTSSLQTTNSCHSATTTVQRIEGEELGKFLRFAIEFAKIEKHVTKPPSYPSGELYHISSKPLKDLIFNPRVPDNYLTRSGFEDSTTKRISFASNIDDALKAMSANLEGKTLYVYKAPIGTPFKTPSKLQVPDVEITSEKWVTSTVKVEPVGTIRIGKAIEKPYRYTYGDNTAELYGWKWCCEKP